MLCCLVSRATQGHIIVILHRLDTTTTTSNWKHIWKLHQWSSIVAQCLQSFQLFHCWLWISLLVFIDLWTEKWLVAGSVWFQYFIEKLWKYLSTCHSQLWLSHLSHSGARTLLSEAGVDQILSPRTSTTSLLPAIINFPVLRLKSIKRKMIKEKIFQFNDKRKILKSLLSSPKKYLVTFMLLSDF